MTQSTLPGLSDVYDKRINLADGGLVRTELEDSPPYLSYDTMQGTTLEDILGLKIAHTPLWSTRAAVDEEKSQLLVQAHLSFLRAGARTLLTSTCVDISTSLSHITPSSQMQIPSRVQHIRARGILS